MSAAKADVKIIAPHMKFPYLGFSTHPSLIFPYFEKAVQMLNINTPKPKIA